MEDECGCSVFRCPFVDRIRRLEEKTIHPVVQDLTEVCLLAGLRVISGRDSVGDYITYLYAGAVPYYKGLDDYPTRRGEGVAFFYKDKGNLEKLINILQAHLDALNHA